MDKNFTNENFESFLRQNADGLRMRPTGKVWKGISKHLNRPKRRIGFALAAFLLMTASLGYYFINTSAKKIPAALVSNSGNQSLFPKNTFERETGKRFSAGNSLPEEKRVYTTPAKKLLMAKKTASLKRNANSADLPTQVKINATPSQNDFISTVVDDQFDYSVTKTEEEPLYKKPIASVLPLSIESVVNLYKPKNRKNKISFQIFFTPTVSYRKLGENKSYLRSLPPNTVTTSANVNDKVLHKPSIGLEAGMVAKYPISKKMKLRAGLQFNVNRFDIRAFPTSTSVATILLNNRSNQPDSLSAVSRYSNTGGSSPSWLQNYYFQISAPVGVEFKIFGDDKFQLGIATTIQPTYILSNKAYVISTNYKNYAEVPDLTRRWNVATSFETFVGYSTGRLSWQVGPQVRYQLLSSFVSKYPVKENLFDFGLKVGISLNK